MTKKQLLGTEIVRGLGFKVHFIDKDKKYNHKDSNSCCAIVTLARVMDKSFDEVYKGLSDLGMKKHRSMVIEENILDYLISYGTYNTTGLIPKDYNEGAAQYLARTGAIKDKRSVFLVFTPGHVFPIINGTIYDYSTNYIDGCMCSPCDIYYFMKIDPEHEYADEIYSDIKKRSKYKEKDNIINYLPLKDKFKKFNPRTDKSKSKTTFTDSIVRAFSKVRNMPYMKVQMYLYSFAVQKGTVMITPVTITAMAEACEMKFNKEEKLPSLYSFLNNKQSGTYIVVVDLKNTVEVTNYYYIPIVDGVLYDATFDHYDIILGKPVIGYFK